MRGRPHALGNMVAAVGERASLGQVTAWMQGNLENALGWADVEWIRARWPGRLLLKGVLDQEDAARAADTAVDGLIVSNHGGRQLDGVPSTAAALPAIADALAGRLPLLVDGGVRSGLDVARMLALGASGVLVGRAWAYALAADGERGVASLIDILVRELRVAMSLTGAARISQLGRGCLARTPQKVTAT